MKELTSLWDETIFFWPTKKNEKLTEQLVSLFGQNKLTRLRYRIIWFLFNLLIFFCPVWILESGQLSKKTGKKIQESQQK